MEWSHIVYVCVFVCFPPAFGVEIRQARDGRSGELTACLDEVGQSNSNSSSLVVNAAHVSIRLD